MYRGNTPFIHVYEANKLFTKCCCCILWMEVVTEFMLSFVGWNTGSIHAWQCSYKKMCWVRVSVSGCLTSGCCSIICSQIQNDMVWKICLKLYIQANKTNWLFSIIKISGWGLFDLKWTMAKKNNHSGRSVKISEWGHRHNLGKNKGGRRGEQNQPWYSEPLFMNESPWKANKNIGGASLTRLHLWVKRLIGDTKFVCLVHNVYRNRITERNLTKILVCNFQEEVTLMNGNCSSQLKLNSSTIVQFISVFNVHVLSYCITGLNRCRCHGRTVA